MLICMDCYKIKDKCDFPSDTCGYHKNRCIGCRNVVREHRDDTKITNYQYERMMAYRESCDKKLQDDLWEKLGEAGMNKDIELFTDSKELNGLMEQYSESLILKLSGIEDAMPEWMDLEE